MREKALIILLFFLVSGSADAARVLSCHDGDTCKIYDGKKIFTARFADIDAPELKQPFGINARDRLLELVADRDVQVKCNGFDRLRRRYSCDLSVAGVDVSAVLIGEGLAWDYPKYSGGKFQALQAQAVAEKRGLWAWAPISPYCWRHYGRAECKDPQHEP